MLTALLHDAHGRLECVMLLAILLGFCVAIPSVTPESVPGTKLLKGEGDLAAHMVAGMGRYLDRELSLVAGQRAQNEQVSGLRGMIGAVDPIPEKPSLEYISRSSDQVEIARGEAYSIYAVRWEALKGVHGEGLLLEPKSCIAQVVAIPDADHTPEQIVGLSPGVPLESQFARRLAENGCRVLVPALIDRKDTWSGHPDVRFTNQPHREFIYRGAYQMGRHIIGYEVAKVRAAAAWLRGRSPLPVGVFGYGEGGLIASYTAAVDTRIQAAAVSGYFGPREGMWSEPIYRNVWSLLRSWGDAELAVAGVRMSPELEYPNPRTFIIEACRHPEVTGPPAPSTGRSGAAPGAIRTPPLEAVRAEFVRARKMLPDTAPTVFLIESGDGAGPFGSDAAVGRFLQALVPGAALKPSGDAPVGRIEPADSDQRQKRQFDELLAHIQRCVEASPRLRAARLPDERTTPADQWANAMNGLRDTFWTQTLGKLPEPDVPLNPRTRLARQESAWKAYEVVLDVYPDVIAQGVLLLPTDMKEGERRPVVVCQHGLEGRASDTISGEGQAFFYYQSYAARLAERGFIVYAPQNPYIGGDSFRQLQRKANPLGLSLFSFIVRQHQRALDWLTSLPYVDSRRIAYYGLSYGGNAAMRVPPLLDQYMAVICSANFNEWIWKTTSSEVPYSYLFTGEYEMFEFNLGDTFNYAEMAAMIAPRPFMVERGHDDGVGPDEWVAYEFAKVFRMYTRLGIPERATIEYFNGPHQIHGRGTFAFLHHHLSWPEPVSK